MEMNWHDRFLQQAGWTRDLRLYLFARAGLTRARRVLEVGCGTGAILTNLDTPAAVHALDLDLPRLLEARLHAPGAILACADALSLPYPPRTFDITFFHFLLLWVSNPLQVLIEMKRVTRFGGAVLALAEPDYTSRVDEPPSLAPLGNWQAESLRRQGADPSLGARLGDLFSQAGINLLETGPLHNSGNRMLLPSERELEWAVLEADLEGAIPDEQVQKMKQLDAEAWARGDRVLHVPTYFAHGVV
jgi:SAM-dependent methyltransferase